MLLNSDVFIVFWDMPLPEKQVVLERLYRTH